MRTNIYQIFDRVASMPSTNIVGFPRDEAAIRWFQEAITNKDSPMARYPDDHQLLKLGQQNLDSGEIDAHLPTVVTDGITERERAEKTWGRNPDLATQEAMKKEFDRRLSAGTPAPAPAANDNGAADASAGVDLTCNTCGELWSNHRKLTSHTFSPRPELQALYDQYLRDQHR